MTTATFLNLLKKTRKVGVVGSSESLFTEAFNLGIFLSSELYVCITLSMAVFFRKKSEPVYIVVYK